MCRKSGKEAKHGGGDEEEEKGGKKRGRREMGLESVLSKEVDAVYRPQTRETKQVRSALCAFDGVASVCCIVRGVVVDTPSQCCAVRAGPSVFALVPARAHRSHSLGYSLYCAVLQAYEVLLQFVQTEVGDKPHDVIRSAADEVRFRCVLSRWLRPAFVLLGFRFVSCAVLSPCFAP